MSKNIPNKQKKSYTFYTMLATVFYSDFIYSTNSISVLNNITISDIKVILDAILWFLLFTWIWFVRYLLINRKNQ